MAAPTRIRITNVRIFDGVYVREGLGSVTINTATRLIEHVSANRELVPEIDYGRMVEEKRLSTVTVLPPEMRVCGHGDALRSNVAERMQQQQQTLNLKCYFGGFDGYDDAWVAEHASEATPSRDMPEDITVVDGKGMWLLPGYASRSVSKCKEMCLTVVKIH